MKSALFAVLATLVAAPAFASETKAVDTRPQVFRAESQKTIGDVTYVRAVSEDGKRVANVRINKKNGEVRAKVDGKRVEIKFEGI
jgi:hypothetical protein